MAAQSDRRIYLHPYEAVGVGVDAPCGAWIATAQADHIFFEQRTSKYHQEQIILHEIGHLLCRHRLHDISETMLSETDLLNDPGKAHGALLRTSYTTQEEKEAELVASMLLERSTSWDGDGAQTGERYLGEVLGFI
ncbi:hypothetical protein BG844_02520 [Couchioplanes caeruleus subsp. caeruleus]|uniref:IrrE N-terminal-like domain-containing protein n=1 Tax=Couchioplanes caeruleus subsp. caeruleus TaxID=56427 RepID=A0A1K0GEY5_9ACTN|nr:hypothetical protein BG844_02520 [Couchioplanes caeruleus subsp. caeruleus]